MTPRSVFIVGVFSPGHLGVSYRRAFEQLGLPTHSFEITNEGQHALPWIIRNRLTQRLIRNNGSVRSMSLRNWNEQFVREVLHSGADTVLSLSMMFLTADAVSTLRRHGIRVVMFYPDNPFPPHYASRPETLPTALAADLCLVWSRRLVMKLREAGVRRAEFLPFGWDPESFPFEQPREREIWRGVLFLGGWDREREEFLEQLASQVPLRIYGPDYWRTRTNSRGRVRHCWQGTDLRLADAAMAIRQSAVCVNILRTQHVIDGHPDAVIMRHFEVPGAGGLLLSTRDGTATSLFPEGQTGEYFSDVRECVAKTNWFLQNEEERLSSIERTHSEVSSRHRYIDRAREILSMIES